MKPSKLSYFMILLLILSLALQPVNTTYFAKAATNSSLEASENAVVTLHSKNKRPSVYADSAILMDANTGAVLYSKRIHKKQYPASITKIMTTLLALENLSPTDTVTFSHDAVFNIERGSSHIGIDEGEELTVEQCLYGIMLASANEVSNAIAEQVAGDNDSFANMMNEKATELGCVNTHFTNPHGLHDKEHYTTAYDMALIAKEAYQNEEYKKIIATDHIIIPPTNIQTEERYIQNHHKMFRQTKFHYEGCTGGKTGYTTDAKNTLVTYAKRGDLELICVVLRTNAQNVYVDTQKILDYGFHNYISYYPTNEQAYQDFVKENPLDNATSDSYIDTNYCITLPKDIVSSNISMNYTKGVEDEKSYLEFTYEDQTIGLAPLNVKEKSSVSSPASSKKEKKKKAINTAIKPILILIVVVILLLGFILFSVKLTLDRRRKSMYIISRSPSRRHHRGPRRHNRRNQLHF